MNCSTAAGGFSREFPVRSLFPVERFGSTCSARCRYTRTHTASSSITPHTIADRQTCRQALPGMPVPRACVFARARGGGRRACVRADSEGAHRKKRLRPRTIAWAPSRLLTLWRIILYYCLIKNRMTQPQSRDLVSALIACVMTLYNNMLY